TITLHLSDDGKRYLNGLVASFAYAGTSHQPGTEKGFALYHARLVPWLWILTLETDSRIFQNLAVPDIVEQVFKDMGFTHFKRTLPGTYDPREHCLQYQETAFASAPRLREAEGIFYYFEHAAGKPPLVLPDASTAATACPAGGTLSYGSPSTWVQQE